MTGCLFFAMFNPTHVEAGAIVTGGITATPGSIIPFTVVQYGKSGNQKRSVVLKQEVAWGTKSGLSNTSRKN